MSMKAGWAAKNPVARAARPRRHRKRDSAQIFSSDAARARAAAGSPTEFQGRAANTGGAVRYTAPSLVFDGLTGKMETGGFQPIEAYDVVIANLDPTLERRPPANDPVEVLSAFPADLTPAAPS